MDLKEQRQQLNPVEAKPEVGAEGGQTSCIGLLFVLDSLLISSSENVREWSALKLMLYVV